MFPGRRLKKGEEKGTPTLQGMSRAVVSVSISLLAADSRAPVTRTTTRMSHCNNP